MRRAIAPPTGQTKSRSPPTSRIIPTVVITGECDFIPFDIAVHIAQAIPNARLITIKDCGHFAFLERPADIHRAVDDFFHHAAGSTRPY